MSKFEKGEKVWWSQRNAKVSAIVVDVPPDNDKRGTVLVRRDEPRTKANVKNTPWPLHEISEFWLTKRDSANG